MEPVLLKNFQKDGNHTIETYLGQGGYKALEKALNMTTDNIIQTVKDSNLRGRGGAGFPTGLKWSFVPKDPTLQKYLACNADEGEPGTFKDRAIMEYDPHLLLEGMAICCHAIGATEAYIYVRGEFDLSANRLEEAIKEAQAKGYLGEKILGTDFKLNIYVHRGAGAYICGEETALLESLEGKKGQPRIRPPFPAVSGLYAKPTVINNVETLAALPSIINKGAEWFKNLGTAKSGGMKIFGVSGHVEKPGLYELPMGITIRELIYDHCGGVRGGKKLKAVIPGGVSAAMLVEADLDTPLDFESLAEKGSMLGSGAVIVMDEDTCMVKASHIITRFFAHESCGKCTPCREGTTWLERTMRRIENGEGTKKDIDTLETVCDNIFGTTLCPLGDSAVMSLQSALKHFREEFDYHIEHKKCQFGN